MAADTGARLAGAAAVRQAVAMTSSRLVGHVALVTGSTKGIGRATAQRFAAEGAGVVVTGRSADLGASVAAGINDAGGDAIYAPVDLNREADIEAAVRASLEHFGKLSILVNNAGPLDLVGPGRGDRALHEIADSDWDEIMTVGLKQLMWCARHVVPAIIAAGGGSIVNISSAASLQGVGGIDAYTASKGAINSLTRSMAVELAASNIRVNSIASGMVLTNKSAIRMMEHPILGPATKALHLTGLGQPEDIAAVALFLASDEARFVTGHNLVADGGATAKMAIPDISALTVAPS